MNKLESCPFCGSKEEPKLLEFCGVWTVECKICRTSVEWCNFNLEAVETWNGKKKNN